MSPDHLESADWTGRRLELLIGPVAHGGHCVARHEGRVVFVRHALPEETVLAEVTEDRGGSFCRADAVEVLVAAPDRVPAPCEYAHPGGCGGCDFQHVSLPGQRLLKAAVLAEQFRRLAGIEVDVPVRPLAEAGLGWRRRIRFAVAPDGRLGLRAHRSHRVIPLEHCPLAEPRVGAGPELAQHWSGADEVTVSTDDEQALAVVTHRTQARPRPRRTWGNDRRRPKPVTVSEQVSGPSLLHHTVAGRRFEVEPDGFWQTHPAAAGVFTERVLAAAALRPGENALDLYAGSGLFTAALADAATGAGRVLGLESDRAAVTSAAANLAGLDRAQVRREAVTADSVATAADEVGGPAVIVLDPPRTGAGAPVMRAVLGTGARVVVYVACDPAALARDVRTALDAGWRMTELTAYDAFPMTHHFECIAVLTAPLVSPASGCGGQ